MLIKYFPAGKTCFWDNLALLLPADSPQVTLIFHCRTKTSSKFIHFFHNTWEKLSSGAQVGSRWSHPAHLSLFVYPLPVT